MTPSPTPIPVSGDVQVFANAECSEYADGTQSKVYVRINTPWEIGGGWYVGDPSDPGTSFSADVDEYPDVDPDYYFTLWVDFQSELRSTPFQAGQIVEMNLPAQLLPVANPTVIFTKP